MTTASRNAHCLVIWLLLFGMQVVYLVQGGFSGCPKLHFLSGHGCQPCSLCDRKNAEKHNLIRKECRSSNPDPVPDGKVLWCDQSNGPFPECPPIDASALLGQCTEVCNANFRTFAPGCECTVGCPGQVLQTIKCTYQLSWNATDFPHHCVPQTTIPLVDEETSSSNFNKVHPTLPNDNIVVPIILGSCVIAIISIITFAVIGTCLYKQRAKLCPPRPSAMPDSTTDFPLLVNNGSAHNAHSSNGEVVVSVDEDEVQEVPAASAQNAHMETGAVQQRSNNQEQVDSYEALKALLNSRQDLLELTKRFDQEHEFDKVTWHDIAVDLVSWDRHRVRNIEFMARPQCKRQSRDGPMYQVLEDARQKGKGLLDLIACLQQQRFRSRESEEVLQRFWHRWKSEQTSGAPQLVDLCV